MSATPKIDIPLSARRQLSIAAAMLVRAWREVESQDYPRFSAASEALRQAVPEDLIEELADALDRFSFPSRVLAGEVHEKRRQERLRKDVS